MKEDELQEGDWGPDEGYFLAYKDGFPVPLTEVQVDAEFEADAAIRALDEAARTRLCELLQRERAMSAERRILHARIDFIRSQASASNTVAQQLAYLIAKERAVSDRRALIHSQIDELRGTTPRRRPRN